MIAAFPNYTIEPIHTKYAWRLCDFCTVNATRLQRFFPKTVEQNFTPDLSRYFIERKIKEFDAKKEFLFVLKEKEDHTLLGIIYIKDMDWAKKQAEVAYCIGYQYEGKGYTTEAVLKMSKWAIEELQLQTLRIIVHKTNIASIRVAEKCGYLWKRTLKKEHIPPGEDPLDMELYELSV